MICDQAPKATCLLLLSGHSCEKSAEGALSVDFLTCFMVFISDFNVVLEYFFFFTFDVNVSG